MSFPRPGFENVEHTRGIQTPPRGIAPLLPSHPLPLHPDRRGFPLGPTSVALNVAQCRPRAPPRTAQPADNRSPPPWRPLCPQRLEDTRSISSVWQESERTGRSHHDEPLPRGSCFVGFSRLAYNVGPVSGRSLIGWLFIAPVERRVCCASQSDPRDVGETSAERRRGPDSPTITVHICRSQERGCGRSRIHAYRRAAPESREKNDGGG